MFYYFYGDRCPKKAEEEKWEMGPRRGMNQVGSYTTAFSNSVKLLSNKLTDGSILHLSRDCTNYCFFGEFLLGEEGRIYPVVPKNHCQRFIPWEPSGTPGLHT